MSGRAEPLLTVVEEGVVTDPKVGQPIVSAVSQSVASQLANASPAPAPSHHLRKILMNGASSSTSQSSTLELDGDRHTLEGPQETSRASLLGTASTPTTMNTAQLAHTAETHTTEPQQRTWSGWWSSVVSSTTSVLDTIGKATIGAIKLTTEVVTTGLSVAKQIVTDPAAAIASAWSAVKAVASFALTAGTYLVNGAIALGKWCLEHPDRILPAIGSFLYSAGEFVVSLVKDLASSVWNGIKKVASGEMTIGEALLNTFIFCCEMSGLADLWGMVKHGTLALAAYATGDKQAMYSHLGQAAMHGAFVAIAVATIGTGGLAAPVLVPLMAMRSLVGVALKQGLKQGLKACAREFLECGAKQIGETALKKMGEPAAKKLAAEFPQEMAKITVMAEKAVGPGASTQALTAKVNELALERVIQLQGDNIAKTMGRSMSDDLANKGTEVLTRQYVTKLGEEVGYSQTKGLLKELGLTQYVDDLTYDMLTSMRDMSHKQARTHLIDTMGLSRKQADEMAREMQRLIKSGKSDDAIKQALEDRITKDVSKFVADTMGPSFKETFKKGLRGELTDPDNVAWSTKLRQAIENRADDLAKDPKTNPYGKSARELTADLTDDLVEGGWEGVEAGIKKAARGLIREGIENAFKRLRTRRLPNAAVNNDPDEVEAANSTTSDPLRLDDTKLGVDLATKGPPNEASAAYQQPEIRHEIVTLADGRTVRLSRTFDESERLLRKDEEVISGPTRKERAKATDDDFGTAA